ncbi:hypothetical protein B5807_02643 [Epicoccum nigrum]|uniref:Uncharacterized protein n=1 Tax=Epicoccum nigrum TaxID=105696 RepID=A0A1Y2MB59_EPING|nr:hypothetical protein B5807_02643 [Epicoccum nigrum]
MMSLRLNRSKQFFSCARQPTELRGGFMRNRDGNKEVRCLAVAIEAGIYDGGKRLVVQANQQGSAAFPSAKGRHCRPAAPKLSSLQPPCLSTPTWFYSALL